MTTDLNLSKMRSEYGFPVRYYLSANDTEIDMNASRRVEIKFRLKEDEMIEKIAEILGQ